VTPSDRGTVSVEVELTEPMIELIEDVKEEEAPLFREGRKPIAEWIEEAAMLRLRRLERKHKVPATAHIPEEAVERAKLHAEDRRIRTGEPQDFQERVSEFIDLEFEYDDVDE
jgi:hypothetical protein